MTRCLLMIAVGWSLVLAPTLCRAGVLVNCCEPLPADPGAEPEGGCGDCDCNRPEQGPTSTPSQRQCGSCAGMCTAVAKPLDGIPTLNPAAQTPLAIFDAPVHTRPAGAPCRHAVHRPPDQHCLPFPLSDIPLLI